MPVVYLAMFFKVAYWHLGHYIDGLVQEGRNSSALAMELHLSYTLSREYRVARYRYSRLLFTSEDRLCAKLRVQWQ